MAERHRRVAQKLVAVLLFVAFVACFLLQVREQVNSTKQTSSRFHIFLSCVIFSLGDQVPGEGDGDGD